MVWYPSNPQNFIKIENCEARSNAVFSLIGALTEIAVPERNGHISWKHSTRTVNELDDRLARDLLSARTEIGKETRPLGYLPNPAVVERVTHVMYCAEDSTHGYMHLGWEEFDKMGRPRVISQDFTLKPTQKLSS